MFFKSVIIATIFAALSGALARDVSFNTCAGNVHSVAINPCDSEPCKLKYGQSYNFDIVFTSDVDSSNPRSSIVSSFKGDDEFPYPGQSFSACTYVGEENCPLKSGQTYTYSYTATVTLHPNFDNFRFNVTNDFFGKTIFCADVDLESEGTSDI